MAKRLTAKLVKISTVPVQGRWNALDLQSDLSMVKHSAMKKYVMRG
jgi:hypothetical protein